MKELNDVEVIINNKRYTLCGYESDAYLQMVASYINDKYDLFKQQDSYARLETDIKNTLMQINIADDYFKEKEKVRTLEDELEAKNNELFDIKHEVISLQTKLDELKKELDKEKEDSIEAQKQIVKLETELKEREHKK
ncbi:cell division protein ZapA [Velocimicrobium porci]|uniref:Cell division protein ZapA n=1 Tax=Velocimicrobium porci TaxID=2606634 RepID=A0A6L5XX30_9FIRM|nr:cell division protein ZapA [Velocimicrobium porci]MSS63315.1 cell division protein ZapA [Velocimicrobium porci]